MSSIRKIGILVGITGLVLAMASGTSFAATIKILEFVNGSYTDGIPEVNCVSPCSDFTGMQITSFAEPPGTTHITGTFTFGSNLPLNLGTYGVNLTETPDGTPAASRVISDTVQLTVTLGPAACTPLCQTITIDFTSNTDGTPLAGLTGFPNRQETGDVQNVSDALKTAVGGSGYDPNATNIFIVKVQSDPPEVPEPTTLLLLGSGLAGLWFWRRRHA